MTSHASTRPWMSRSVSVLGVALLMTLPGRLLADEPDLFAQLEQIQRAFEELGERYGPNVVAVRSQRRLSTLHGGNPFDDVDDNEFYQSKDRLVQAAGSGVIIRANGVILTNEHVVRDPKTRQMVDFRADEHMRPETTLDGLAKLKPYFKKDGLVTAGNASGICDGGAAVVVASEQVATRKGLKPLGRLVAWTVAGVEPKYMGIGPVPAIRKLLQKTGMTFEQVDLVEVNEAFAPQYVAVEKELGLPREKTNVHGGAIAIGHPLAASGTRITAHLLHALRLKGGKYGIGSACIGGGQGIAVLVEAFPK